jgi:hypothetical protein
MKARLVTGYIPIIGQPRGVKEYGELGEKLGGVPVRKKAFYMRVEDTWLAQHVRLLPYRPSWSAGDNPDKNSLAYHCVQHEKIKWLKQAAIENPDDDIMVWVDYGIFHQPGVCNEAIVRFMQSLDDRAIYAPGCWGASKHVDPNNPCWRFCGSVLAVPSRYVEQLDQEITDQARATVAVTQNVEWEVNTWARAEAKSSLPWCWYKADHNVSQFTDAPTMRRGKKKHERA